MRNPSLRLLMVLLASSGLSGCGTAVPNIKEAWDTDIPGDPTGPHGPRAPISGTGQIEFEIKRQIFCDLKDAVRAANSYHNEKSDGTIGAFLPQDWGAQVSISLEVDESSALNPGVAFNTPMANAISYFGVVNNAPVAVTTPQLFSLGLGGTLSSTATRIDKFDPYWTIAELSKPTPHKLVNGLVPVCNREDPNSDPFVALGLGYKPAKSSPFIESDLGLTQWLLGALFTNQDIPSVTGQTPFKKQLEEERKLLGKHGFTTDQITKIVASGALSTDVTTLERDGFSHAEIAKYLAAGEAPTNLHALKNEGYNSAEIAAITASNKAKASQQAKSGGSGSSQTPDTISVEIKFVIVSNGNVTPTWKLVRLSADTGSTPLFGIGRTRIHDVIITIGPNTQATANTHLASQIGNAVGNANRPVLGPSNTN